jgi:hypothetical protein
VCITAVLQNLAFWYKGRTEIENKMLRIFHSKGELITKKRKKIKLYTPRFEVLTLVVLKIKVCQMLHWADWKTLTFRRIRLPLIFCLPLVNYCSCSG